MVIINFKLFKTYVNIVSFFVVLYKVNVLNAQMYTHCHYTLTSMYK